MAQRPSSDPQPKSFLPGTSQIFSQFTGVNGRSLRRSAERRRRKEAKKTSAKKLNDEHKSAERSAYFASSDSRWLVSYTVSGEGSDWCGFVPGVPLDEAIRLMCDCTGWSYLYDVKPNDLFPDESSGFIDCGDCDSRSLLDIKNECLKNGICENQEGKYPWVIEAEYN